MSGTDDSGEAAPEMPEREGLAAEYALGTLDVGERSDVATRLDVDPELAEAVERWERKLAPLALGVPEVAPPETLWPAIETRLDHLGAGGRPTLHVVRETVATPEDPKQGWRTLALAASLAALVLGGLLAREKLLVTPAPTEPLVAVLSADGKAPAFILSVDVNARALTIRRVGADAPANNSHELWLVSDKVDQGKPVSLGIVGDQPVSAKLAKYDPSTFEGATYAISLEPRGGSKTGAPTGPVIFSGKLTELPGSR